MDIAWLAAFRVLFGLLMCAGLCRFMWSGWVETLFVEPTYFFKYPGFAWVQPWSAQGMYLHYGLLALLALMVALGAWFRWVAPLFTVGFAYVQLIDVTNYLNHYYLVVLLAGLLSVMPAHAAWSVDAARSPGLRRSQVPAWTLYLLRFQIAVVYGYAALAKVGTDWLLHAQPLGLWLSARTETPLLGPLFGHPWAPIAMSWAGFLYDASIPLWLSFRRTRGAAYLVVIGFHVLTSVLFDIGLFPLIMTLSALVFFPPQWPRTLLRRAGLAPRASGTNPLGTGVRPRLPRWGLSLGVAYVALQLVVPLRHFAYPGDVLWNEDGMRWSWKVMVREKHGAVTYHVREQPSGRRMQVAPSRYLNARQEGEMSSQPDLIRQLAHHIRDDFARQGRQVEVRAEVHASLNGRAPALLIDPEVDLARVEGSLAPSRWVLPSPASPPLQLHALRR